MSDFIHYDLGHLKRGSVVVVTIKGNSPNVRLLDTSGFSAYRNGRRHQYIGGLAKRSPVRLAVPRDGRWHVAIDFQGLRGQARTDVHVDPPPPKPLPPIRETSMSAAPLSQIVQNIEAVAPESSVVPKQYDVFVSHATEDKDSVVRELVAALESHDLVVWYDEAELRIGDSLRGKIDAGLVNSRFGIVVLSPSFFAKPWTEYELDGLVTREMAGQQQIILPVWHNISREEVAARSPSLANKVALKTDQISVGDIAAQIAEVVGRHEDAA